MNFLKRVYKYCNEDIVDPRTNKWLFVDSPLTVLLIIITYLYVVRKLGPRFMKNREPFNVEKLMIAYNIIQVSLSSFIVFEILRTYFWQAKPNLFCDPVHLSTTNHSNAFGNKKSNVGEGREDEKLYSYHAFIVYLYFIAKILELLDTVFFVLRKKWNQISTLHIYHHSGMVFVGWAAIKYVPGGQSMLTLALNSFVHIVMYIYYLLLSVDPELRKSIWWKKHITQLQLTQFVIILIHHFIAFIANCGYPRTVSYWVLNHIIFIFLLFADFYRKAYLVKKNKRHSESKIN